MDINKCISTVSREEALLQGNLITNKKLKCEEKLLFLYGFLQNNGINIYKHPNIIKNLRLLCDDCCPATLTTTEITDEFEMSVDIICSDNIIAESFVIYG